MIAYSKLFAGKNLVNQRIKMNITVNGDVRECAEGTTLASLINDLGIKVKVMAAAVNMEVVKKDDWKNYTIKENDKIELLHFVGGG